MKNLPFVFLFCLIHLAPFLQAHPSFGLVIADDGSLIFCDVLHHDGTIWKYSPEGELKKLLTGEHSHWIYLDEHGNIWGSQHEYLPATEGNRNTLWKLSPEGEKTVVIQPTEVPEEFGGVNFVVDSKGQIYYTDYQQRVWRLDRQGQRAVIHPQPFQRIMSLQMDRHDNLYVVDNYADGGALFRIDPQGTMTQIAKGLLDETPPNPPFPERRFNMLYAASINDKGQVFVANSGSRRVSRIDASGEITHVYHSQAPWFPVAYCEKEGRKYVMECGFESGKGNIGPRIVQVTSKGKKVLVSTDHPQQEPHILEGAVPRENKKTAGKAEIGKTTWIVGGIIGILLAILLISRRQPRKE